MILLSNEITRRRKLNSYNAVIETSLMYNTEIWETESGNKRTLKAIVMEAS